MSNASFLSGIPIPQSSGLVLQSTTTEPNWIPVSSITGATTVNAGTNINVQTISANDVTVSVTPNVTLTNLTTQSLSLGTTGSTYTLPQSSGLPTQVLTVPTSGSTLEWTYPETASFQAGANIDIINNTISLVGNVVTQSLATSNFTLPQTLGQPGQVVAVPPTGSTLIWETPTSGSGSIEAGPGIVIQTAASVTTIALDEEIVVQSLTVKDDFNTDLFSLPTTDPPQNSILQYTSGSLGNPAVWSSAVTLSGLTLNTDNGLLSFPTTQPDIGGPGMVLTQTLGGLAFKPTILELSEGDNIVISQPTAGSYTIGLNTTITLETGTENVAILNPSELNLSTDSNTTRMTSSSFSLTNDVTGSLIIEMNVSGIYTIALAVTNAGGTTLYSFPQTVGLPGQVLAFPSTGNQLIWATVQSGPGGGTIAGTANQITAQTIGSVTTVALAADISGINTLSCGTNSILSDIGLSLDPIGLNSLHDTGLRASSIALTQQTGPSSEIVFSLPQSLGSPGQVLAVPAAPDTTLEWVTPEASASITSGENIAITVDPGTGDKVISLASTISLAGVAGSVTIADNQITLEPSSGSPTFQATEYGVSTTELTILSTNGLPLYGLPLSSGSPGQVMVVPPSGGNLVFEDPQAVSIVAVPGSNVTVTPNGATTEIGFGSDPVFNTVNTGSYSLTPTGIPPYTQTLISLDQSGVPSFIPVPTASGSLIGGSNITVVTDVATTSVALDDPVSLDQYIEAGSVLDGKNKSQLGFITSADDNGLYQSNDIENSFLSANALKVPMIQIFSSTLGLNYTLPILQPNQGQIIGALDNSGNLGWVDAAAPQTFTASANVVINFDTPGAAFPVHMNSPVQVNGEWDFEPSLQNMKAQIKLKGNSGVFSFFDDSVNYTGLCSTIAFPSSSTVGYRLTAVFENVPLEFMPENLPQGYSVKRILPDLPFMLNTAQLAQTSTSSYTNCFIVNSSSRRMGDYSSYGMPVQVTFTNTPLNLLQIRFDVYYPVTVRNTATNDLIYFNNGNVPNLFGGGSQQYFTIYPTSLLMVGYNISGNNLTPDVVDYPQTFTIS